MNKLILTHNMWLNMCEDGKSKGYEHAAEFIRNEGIGRLCFYNNNGYGSRLGFNNNGYVEFNTPELMTFYTLRWS